MPYNEIHVDVVLSLEKHKKRDKKLDALKLELVVAGQPFTFSASGVLGTPKATARSMLTITNQQNNRDESPVQTVSKGK